MKIRSSNEGYMMCKAFMKHIIRTYEVDVNTLGANSRIHTKREECNFFNYISKFHFKHI